MSQRRILVSGATGFIGAGVVKKLMSVSGVQVLAGGRSSERWLPNGVLYFHLGDLEAPLCCESLDGVSVLVHCAARVHVMIDKVADPLAEFRKINVGGTLGLARQAADAGVKRFIFISSIKVNGESTVLGKPYKAEDIPAPVDPYGISKMEAEQGLMALAAETGMEVTIIRPVLVYGPGVKANFHSMMEWISKRVPLPLGCIHNKRSMVALDNLVDLVAVCVDHPAAANQVFLVSDGEDLSTTALLLRTAKALGKPLCLLPVPVFLLNICARLLGKLNIARRLYGSLQVDIEKTRILLNWTPPVSVDRALCKTARHFLEQKKI